MTDPRVAEIEHVAKALWDTSDVPEGEPLCEWERAPREVADMYRTDAEEAITALDAFRAQRSAA